jgi:hypothetical protein
MIIGNRYNWIGQPESPKKKEFVSLTDDEIDSVSWSANVIDSLNDPWDCNVGDGDETRSILKDLRKFAKAYETVLRKKNGI